MLFTWRHMCKFACPFQRPKDAFVGKEVSPQHFEKTGQILAASLQEPLFFPSEHPWVSPLPACSSYRLASRYHTDAMTPVQSYFAKNGSYFSTLQFVLSLHKLSPTTQTHQGPLKALWSSVSPSIMRGKGEGIKFRMPWGRKVLRVWQ